MMPISDEMVEAFGAAWEATPAGEPGARRRAGLQAALATIADVLDAAKLLGPARAALDAAAQREAGADRMCADMAQRIVDLIGHHVTDEPPHALVERDNLRVELVRVKAQRDALNREVRHEQRIRQAYWVELWKAVTDRNDAPDYWLINQSDLICAIQDSDSAEQLRGRLASHAREASQAREDDGP